jgi:hypothetical protein
MHPTLWRRWPRAWLVGVLLAAGLAFPGLAQVYTPTRGTTERSAILDTVRLRVESEVGKPVEFAVNQFRVLGAWAFVSLSPQRPGGGAIDWSHSRYQPWIDVGAFDAQVTALLRQTPHGWLIYEYDLGATDVVWIDWAERHAVPPELFP